MFDDVRRHEILGLAIPREKYDIHYFEGATVDRLWKLVEEGYLQMEDRQNNSPCTADYIYFLEGNKKATAHGYAITPDREDCRVTIEGLNYQGEVDLPMAIDFLNLFRDADEFSLEQDGFYCWFD